MEHPQTSFPSDWPRVWRGESGGELFDTFENGKTRHGIGFFFAQSHEHATYYAGFDTQPRPFVLDPGNVLDLLDPHGLHLKNSQAQAVLNGVRQAFDEWIDRSSGEERDLTDFLEAGDLYDYEGTGSAERWNTLFVEARAAGYNSVKVRDYTDGVTGDDAIVWVVFDPSRIHHAIAPQPSVVSAPNRRRPSP